MSDREFWKFFSSLIAGLAALAVVLFVLAQVVGGKSETKNVGAVDSKTVADRIKPIGEVAVKTGGVVDALIAPANAGDDAKGKATYEASCAVCHGAGIAGAPKLGDKTAWKNRISQGKDTLYKHALVGFQGKAGTVMPPKGGNMNLADANVKAAVDYMVSSAK
jgi:cytochrome c5